MVDWQLTVAEIKHFQNADPTKKNQLDVKTKQTHERWTKPRNFMYMVFISFGNWALQINRSSALGVPTARSK